MHTRRRYRTAGGPSRLEPDDLPLLADGAKEVPVVEPVVAMLPELERVRDEPVAAPRARPRRLLRLRRDGGFERRPRLDRTRLRRGRRASPRRRRPRRPVRVRLLS